MVCRAWYAGKEGCKTRGIQDKRNAGQDGSRKVGMKGRRDEERR